MYHHCNETESQMSAENSNPNFLHGFSIFLIGPASELRNNTAYFLQKYYTGTVIEKNDEGYYKVYGPIYQAGRADIYCQPFREGDREDPFFLVGWGVNFISVRIHNDVSRKIIVSAGSVNIPLRSVTIHKYDGQSFDIRSILKDLVPEMNIEKELNDYIFRSINEEIALIMQRMDRDKTHSVNEVNSPGPAQEPYRTEQTANFNVGTHTLETEIEQLEEQKREIERQLNEKVNQLKEINEQGNNM